MTVEEFNKQPSVQEFHSIRKQFYLDADSLLVKFPDARHSKMNHAEWFADYGVPWTHMVRGYYLKTENDEFLDKLAYNLKKYSCQYYTCHCTGWEPYLYLKQQMGEQLYYLQAGETVTI